MKFVFCFSFLTFILGACNSPSKDSSMHLTAEVKGLRKGVLLLQRYNDSIISTIDSAKVNKPGVFKFSTPIKEPEILYLTLRFLDSISDDIHLPFFAEANPITITTNLDNFTSQAQITGSVNQQKIEEYKKLMTRYRNRSLDLIGDQLNALKDQNDSLAILKNQQSKAIIKNKYLATVNFALNNKNFEIAPYLTLTEIHDAHLKYLDTIYKSLTPKIKNSKYGKQLEFFINNKSN